MDLNLAAKLSLLASGLFLVNGMIVGVWKYAKIMSSPENRAPVYVDIAHRTSLLYSFACLVIGALVSFSPFGNNMQVLIVLAPIVFFALTVYGYMKEGYLDRTGNMFSESNLVTTWFMYGLIAAEIGGISLLIGGFIFTQFLR